MISRISLFETDRLLLRPWKDADVAPFALMNQDPQVLAHFPKLLTFEESNGLITRIKKHFDVHGFGLWAVELKETQEFMGFVGLNVPDFSAPFMPCVEMGWRLCARAWGKGYATEAAKKVLELGFSAFGLQEIVSFTVPANVRSIRVMEKLGMTRDLGGDFNHPKIDEGHALCRHVLYRVGCGSSFEIMLNSHPHERDPQT